jgi:hypothetical protein
LLLKIASKPPLNFVSYYFRHCKIRVFHVPTLVDHVSQILSDLLVYVESYADDKIVGRFIVQWKRSFLNPIEAFIILISQTMYVSYVATRLLRLLVPMHMACLKIEDLRARQVRTAS